jgi:hypothetical protein
MSFRLLVSIAVDLFPDAQRSATAGRNKRTFVDKSATPSISINAKAGASRSASSNEPDPRLMKPWTTSSFKRWSPVVGAWGVVAVGEPHPRYNKGRAGFFLGCAARALMGWSGAAGTSRSEDEEVPTSSAPLTKTNGGYEVRIYDQVMLRATEEVQTSTLLNNIDQPRKK